MIQSDHAERSLIRAISRRLAGTCRKLHKSHPHEIRDLSRYYVMNEWRNYLEGPYMNTMADLQTYYVSLVAPVA